MQTQKVYTSAIGKLYQEKRKQIVEDAWVDELVEKIIGDITYCIEVEGQELPINATMIGSTIVKITSQEDSDKVINALKVKGVIARRESGFIYDFFVVEDFL